MNMYEHTNTNTYTHAHIYIHASVCVVHENDTYVFSVDALFSRLIALMIHMICKSRREIVKETRESQ